jgi:2,5-diketo-D-gluconate reductase B
MIKIPQQQKTGIPLLGLGTWNLKGEECEKTVKAALELGYRHIDTADLYQNHEDVGRAISPWPREELFLVTKIGMEDLLPDQVHTTVPRFLKELNTSYLDLLMIHWPNPAVDLSKTLAAMLAFKDRGIVRNIGISNFVRFHLEELAPYHFPIVTNQIELHPYLQRKELVADCKKHGISLTAYRPLGKGALATDPILSSIGAKYNKTASQVALRWLVQQDIVVIPKAANPRHLKENMEIFDFKLSEEEMQEIAQLDQNKRFCNPSNFPVFED